MPEGERPREVRPQKWDYKEFLANLKLAALDQLPASPEAMPSQIDIGIFGTTLKEMKRKTDADPEKRERMRTIKTQMDVKHHKVLIDKEYIGTNEAVQARIELLHDVAADGLTAITEQHLGSLHTHPSENPFSPTDLSSLLRPETGQKAAGNKMSIIATDTLLMALFKTAKTPTINDERNVEALIRIWESLQGMKPAKGEAAWAMAQYEFLREECAKLHIALYSSPLERDNNILTKASA
ncbi:MAG: hypothetical protein WC480_04750 [Patescibacteria group bacterium]